jgi:dienelactone hydrolase
MAEVVVFHHVQGLTPGVNAFADELRRAGHAVHTPDLFEGRTFDTAAFFALIATWFAILFTGRYPRGIFSFIEGVFRWHNRVIAYALTLVTDRYPPFRLAP